MKLSNIAVYAFKDMVVRDRTKSQVPLVVLVGALTLSVATIISTFSTAFERKVQELMDGAMKPVQGLASTLFISPKAGHFSNFQFRKIMRRICDLEEKGDLEEFSMVVKGIDPNFLTLRRSGDSKKLWRIHIWSVPGDSAFLRSAKKVSGGLIYHSGGSFSDAQDSETACNVYSDIELAAKGRLRGRKSSDNLLQSDDLRLRLGVIMNTKYLEKYEIYENSEVLKSKILKKEFPESIRMGFIHKNRKPGPKELETMLTITGVINEPTEYPDLIFTEDLARVYYFALDAVKTCSDIIKLGTFSAEFAAKFDQWETGKPLVKEKAVAEIRNLPVHGEKLAYVQFNKSKCVPYNLLILKVRNWTMEDTRDVIKNRMLDDIELNLNFSEEEAKHLYELARASISDDDLSRSSQTRALEKLRDLIESKEGRLLRLPENIEVARINDSNSKYLVKNGGRSLLTITDPEGKILPWIKLHAPWNVKVPAKKLVTALLRLQSILSTYSYVMSIVVVLLAFSASFLLAFNHILQKTRDIGILLANGGSKTTIFGIYIGQIGLMVLGGCLCGVALSFVMAPLLEEQAINVIDRFLAPLPEQHDETIKDLDLDFQIFGRAVSWVVAAALIGALYPIFRATRLDPVASIGKGG